MNTNTNFQKDISEVKVGTGNYCNVDFKEAEYLARLWALFGTPAEEEEGWGYYIKHNPSGVVFTAYTGPSGPAIGSSDKDDEEIASVIEEFKQLLSATLPVDCEFEYKYPDTGSNIKVGYKNGKPFFEENPI